MEQTVAVELGPRSYEVRVGAGVMSSVGLAVGELGGVTGTVVITDSNVGPLYAEAVLASLAEQRIPANSIQFPAGEQHKTLATCGKIYDGLFAVDPAIDRGSVVVALGGGVVGDVAGFIAATALRGIRYVQCPTTLLADVDASVGGKTGIDHQAGKNLIGAFHQPKAVLIDSAALKTLRADQLQNGLAECVKHAVIRDAGLLEFLEDNAAKILACGEDVMTELIARNVRIKAEVVSADEREAGQRAHLNFGHTIGHAVEVLVGYDRMPHGQAVSIGMVAACHMAVKRGIIEQDTAEDVELVLGRFNLPVRIEGLDADEIWRIMQHDKKALGGQVRMVLPVVLGQVAIFDDITPEMVTEALRYVQG